MGLKKKIALAFLYVFLFVLLTFVFLLFRFPYKAFIQKEIDKLATLVNYQVTYEGLELDFPPKAVFKDITIQDLNILAPLSNKVLELDHLELSFSLQSFLRTINVDFLARGYGGSISGQEHFGWQDNSHEIDAKFRNIHLEKYPLWRNFSQFTSIKGILSGQFEWESTALTNLEGRLQIKVKNILIRGVKAAGLFEELAFSDCRSSLTLKNRSLIIEKVQLSGDMFRIETAGEIPLASHLSATPVNLPLVVYPLLTQEKSKFPIPLLNFGKQTGNFTVYVRGTLGAPYVSLNPF